MPDVAVIVPLHRLTSEARQCIDTVLGLRDPRAELVVVCDRRPADLPPGVRVIETGSSTDTSPAEKRDAALLHTDAPICAFIDDDAYPAPDWVERALSRFAEDPSLQALGGPGITPPNSSFRRRLAGAFYESRLGSGGLRHRFVPSRPRREVDDWPAYNFFVRTDVLKAVGGWGSHYYGGEDTKLCLALREGGYRTGYDPQVIVYHHRRPVFGALMKQTGNVGRRRGSFVRHYPATSRRAVYFVPTVVLFVAPVVYAAALRAHSVARVAAVTMLAWAGISALARYDGARIDESAALPIALAAAHGAYGWGFLRGLLGTLTAGEPQC
ncbi:MAG: glycosyltransferase [Solirubrobacteraceae bacterium]|jgi:glycosyltransferase involved in cell wall biosynthesis